MEAIEFLDVIYGDIEVRQRDNGSSMGRDCQKQVRRVAGEARLRTALPVDARELGEHILLGRRVHR